MKIGICLQCDKRMKELTNLLWCESCDLTAPKDKLFPETQKCQGWELATWWKVAPPRWIKIPPYERRRKAWSKKMN